MKKINLLLRKCKSLSMQLGRRRNGDDKCGVGGEGDHQERGTIYVGSTRKRYVVSSKYLKHPLLNALIEKQGGENHMLLVRCEVVLFDYFLWLLENSDPNLILDSLEELTDLYAL
ncbi:SMALL AUXIN UPREGULATED RNA 74 [Hibiscus trionum]|uniref:SMALL AUXIN UPREGULATED RNA 74 n=1 Tax=Hibiscus trionum TaxID=183268 RepID=A0A9W7MSQ2_HIBTR|nr:SMALL AUXIN UPREGULATED RNA 74 [Hibiscus trionum]